MKWARRVAAFAGSLVVLYGYLALLHPRQRVEEHDFFQTIPVRVIAHRGGLGLWPENTLFAFRRARDLGVDAIEMDVRSAVDGTLLVMHDATVDRTTDGTGRVADMPLEALRRLDAGYRFEDDAGEHPYRGRGIGVPTFAEVLDELAGTRLNVEMKQFSRADATRFCGLLRRYRAGRSVLVGSFDHEPMQAFRQACPEVATSATVREGLAFYQLHRVGLGSLYRGPAVAFQVPEWYGDIHVIEPAFLAHAKRVNLRVHVWVVNELEDMRRLLALGVGGILTDRPDRLLDLLKRRTTFRE